MRGGLVPAPTASMWGIVRTFQGATRSAKRPCTISLLHALYLLSSLLVRSLMVR
jgi:hypothetical protein